MNIPSTWNGKSLKKSCSAVWLHVCCMFGMLFVRGSRLHILSTLKRKTGKVRVRGSNSTPSTLNIPSTLKSTSVKERLKRQFANHDVRFAPKVFSELRSKGVNLHSMPCCIVAWHLSNRKKR